MKHVLLFSGVGLIGMVMLLAGVAAVSPLGRAPLSLHAWFVSPVACAGSSCVTYRAWSAAVRRDRGAHDALEVLTFLLEERATAVVAFREHLRISDAEVEQALGEVHATLDGVPGGREVLADAYGVNAKRRIREGLRALLLREKLAAAGIPSPWKAPEPPPVAVWNIHLRWDPSQQKVMASSGALAGEKKTR